LLRKLIIFNPSRKSRVLSDICSHLNYQKGKKTGTDPSQSSQYVSVTHSTLLQETTTDPALDLEDDEDDTAHLAGFGGWEIEDSEIKRKLTISFTTTRICCP
jgi:hypothetical protein